MNGAVNAPIVRDDTMLNIRFIPVDAFTRKASTRIWQYIGLPERVYDHTERRWRMMAPSLQVFCDWWRQMRKDGKVPTGQYQGWEFELAQLLIGGYFAHDPNTGLVHENATVCYAKLVEEIPLSRGMDLYRLPDEPRSIILQN